MTILLWARSQIGDDPLTPSTTIIVGAGALLVANADGPTDIPLPQASLKDPQGNVIVPSHDVTVTIAQALDDDQTRYAAKLVAPLTLGTYMLVWQGVEPDQTAWQPVLVQIGVKPSLEQVAALIRARTKVKGGAEVGTFTAATRPTDAQVDELIDEALDEVLGKVQPIDLSLPPGGGYNAPGSDYERRIKRAVALYTAILVELSYYPEQVRTGQSPVATFQALYDSRIRALIAEGETGRAEGMGQGTSGSGDAPADAAWTFPDAMPGALVGWASRW